MELPSKKFEQIAFNTKTKSELHIMIGMDKSIHEEHIFQTLQTNIKQFKTITVQTGYNGIFNITTSKNSFDFTTTFDDDDFSFITVSPGVDELQYLDNKLERLLSRKDILQK